MTEVTTSGAPASAAEGWVLSAPVAADVETARDPLQPAIWELAGLGTLIFTLLLGETAIGFSAYEALNWMAPVWLMAVLALGALRMARIEVRCVWSSLYWFRLATAVYFGFGSLAPSLVNPIALVQMNNFYEARPDEVFKLNLIVAISCLTALCANSVTAALVRKRTMAPVADRARSSFLYGLLFAAVGYSVKLLVEVPMSFGAFGGKIIAGAILQLSQLSYVGLYLLCLHAFKGRPKLLPFVVFLLLADMFVGAVQFSKFSMLLPLMMFLLAWLSSRMTVARAVAAAVFFLTLYSASQPFIEFGRASLERKFFSISSGTFSDRLEIIRQYESGERSDPFQEEMPSSIMRLSYVNAGSFAISRYDGGEPGPSLDYAFATFVPRFLWPEKPIITDIGTLFNMMATGSGKSSSAPGYFADAYWAAGWMGVFAFMTALGVLFTLYSRFTIAVLESGRWLFIPLSLLAMKMGLRVDGALVSDVIGASVIWFWAFVGAHMIERVVNGLMQVFERRRLEGLD